MGCTEVYFFDPQPTCTADIALTLAGNTWPADGRARVIPEAVSNTEEVLSIDTKFMCNGRWPQVSIEEEALGLVDDAGAGHSSIVVRARPLSLSVPEDSHIVLAKVDTEGHEYFVLQTLMPYIRAGQVSNVVFEVTPSWWAHYNLSIDTVLDGFVSLVADHGFVCFELVDEHIFHHAYHSSNLGALRSALAGHGHKGSVYQRDFWFTRAKFHQSQEHPIHSTDNVTSV
jgi:FkbM family methyltransferase